MGLMTMKQRPATNLHIQAKLLEMCTTLALVTNPFAENCLNWPMKNIYGYSQWGMGIDIPNGYTSTLCYNN